MDWKPEAPAGDLPMLQWNANLEDELVTRVGVPHAGGKLAYNAFVNNYRVMVSASAFWKADKGEFRVPYASDLEECEFALDSAGFTAMRRWKEKGRQAGLAGIFPWTLPQYIQLVMDLRPSWWSAPDLCCEPEICSNQAEIDFRVDGTATLLEATLRQVYAYQNDLARTGHNSREIMNILKPCVCVIQGWRADDYLRCLELVLEVWERWRPWLATPTLIGIGSVCRRNLNHKEHGLFAILAKLEPYLPAGALLHLFGVKGAAVEKVRMLDYVQGGDSMAYDFSARVKAREAGISNSFAHRTAEMDRWMTSAAERARAKPGDQLRLGFHA